MEDDVLRLAADAEAIVVKKRTGSIPVVLRFCDGPIAG